ncbi:MAG: sigma 54-interacting transcriptional regulator [Desulfobulbus sp.]|jgi:DNA-binding NtrC family response regulator|uniref:sigma-54 dependent transcriptional regulator n=1 Tax=Desulfobulbus sp. TaxID=895 RepID=UPI00284ED031|nr:sigma 54-interacting transcriptional regulator [Desulfobulbus sp.]MDR2549758.1 sigma 54-interacting transcriptional regulator [Desulfobulbus sp.]
MDNKIYSSKILIVDDEDSIRQTFSIFLKAEGYKFIKTASNYDEAIDAVRESEYDLIISDIVLTGYSGTDLLKEIRDLGVICPVVMITGFPNLKTAAKSIRYGAYDYISKPVNKENLLHFTRHALEHWHVTKKTRLLQQENEKYRRYLDTIFHSVGDAIITVDSQMNVVQLNGKAKQWLYYVDFEKFQNLLHWPVDTLCHAFIDDVRKILQGGQEVRKHIIECTTPDHVTKMLSINASPLRDENNELQGVVIVARDMETSKTPERGQSRSSFHRFVDSSPAMQRVYGLIENIGKVDTSVLVTGESGTGKELAAEALHAESSRRNRPLIKMDCASFSENLLESELFGHRKGAFTGADRDRAGRLLQADGGTLFLDEIGEISPRTQLFLLRFLQEKTFTPLGLDESIHVDVRIIAASNVDFQKMVQAGKFREDLYYRLKVIEIHLPPLRERADSIPLLANHFLITFRKQLGKNIASISDQALECMLRYSWPGNVRELKHVIERACVLCQDGVLQVKHLPLEVQTASTREIELAVPLTLAPTDFSTSPLDLARPMPPYQSEEEKLRKALRYANNNRAKAAKLLGVSRSTLYRWMERYQLTEE